MRSWNFWIQERRGGEKKNA